MPPGIELKITGVSPLAWWLMAKGKYEIRISRETSEAHCSCPGDAFLKGGRDQKECSHIAAARKLINKVWGTKA